MEKEGEKQMTTMSKNFMEEGYCVVDKNKVHIYIKYTACPKVRPSDIQEYCKTSNECWSLRKGKCDLGNECPIFKNAIGVRTD